MKNLMVFISPQNKFTPECNTLVRIQLDNCARLGIKPDDVVLATSFPFEYNGYKSVLTKTEHFCAVRPRSIKTYIVKDLVDEGIMVPNEIYWNHDMDAFQINPITDEELEMDGYDAGLTDYGWRPRLCMGSFFCTSGFAKIARKAKPYVFKDIEDEDVMAILLKRPYVAKKCKMMNITYNIGQRWVPSNLKRATQPPKVFHFHPRKPGLMEVFKPLMPPDLVKIMAEHGYK